MTWNYSGDPSASLRDTVRFLIGDTDPADPLISDEEIGYALTKFAKPELAGAIALRSLAAKWARIGTSAVGELSVDKRTSVQEFVARANELDPARLTMLSSFPVPISGTTDRTASFKKGMNDIPGGPGDDFDTVPFNPLIQDE
jgi:hypothetical protein